jgi:hypothetical protein
VATLIHHPNYGSHPPLIFLLITSIAGIFFGTTLLIWNHGSATLSRTRENMDLIRHDSPSPIPSGRSFILAIVREFRSDHAASLVHMGLHSRLLASICPFHRTASTLIHQMLRFSTARYQRQRWGAAAPPPHTILSLLDIPWFRVPQLGPRRLVVPRGHSSFRRIQ